MAVESPREVALKALRRHLADAPVNGGRLPPERELASQMKVGRRTVREALSVLEQEGAIWRRQGQGTFYGAAKLVGERDPLAAAVAMQDHLRNVSASLLSADPPFTTPV